MKYLCSSFRILVIAVHNARTFDSKLAGFTLSNRIALGINDLCFPSIAWHTDGTNLVDILNSKVDSAWSDGFTKSVIGVILMMRKVFLPVLDQAWRNRLGTNVHQSPLRQLVIFKL